MDIKILHCAEMISYKRPLAALLATLRRDKVVPTILEVVFSCLVEEWSLVRLVAKRHYWAHEQYF